MVPLLFEYPRRETAGMTECKKAYEIAHLGVDNTNPQIFEGQRIEVSQDAKI